MLLILLRHGVAEDAKDDSDFGDGARHLTKEGRRGVKKMARFLRKRDAAPTHIYSSPRVRALESADIVREEFEAEDIGILPSLDIGGAWPAFVKDLTRRVTDKDAVVVVAGHEPVLGQFLGNALGFPEGAIPLKKGAMVALQFGDASLRSVAELAWAMAPKLL